MAKIIVVYKCRMCEKLFGDHEETSDKNQGLMLFDLVNSVVYPKVGAPPLLAAHPHEDGSYGLADMIGAQPSS